MNAATDCWQQLTTQHSGLAVLIDAVRHAQCSPYFLTPSVFRSEYTSEGKRVTKLDQILLNGNNVALLVPGSE